MAIKFLGNSSAGQPLAVGETRAVNLSGENLDIASGYEGDSIVYSVTMIDDTATVLPAGFLVTLKLNGADLVTDQDLNAGVYDGTGLLTIPFTVPAGEGSFTVTLNWAEQII